MWTNRKLLSHGAMKSSDQRCGYVLDKLSFQALDKFLIIAVILTNYC